MHKEYVLTPGIPLVIQLLGVKTHDSRSYLLPQVASHLLTAFNDTNPHFISSIMQHLQMSLAATHSSVLPSQTRQVLQEFFLWLVYVHFVHFG